MPLKVIGAGLPRTGTLSLKHALEQLGFGRCHHMTELARNPDRWPLWERAFDGEPVEWEEIFQGFGATVDAPSCFFYREIAERYPEAKVILTVRDPNRWFELDAGDRARQRTSGESRPNADRRLHAENVRLRGKEARHEHVRCRHAGRTA